LAFSISPNEIKPGAKAYAKPKEGKDFETFAESTFPSSFKDPLLFFRRKRWERIPCGFTEN